MSRMQFTIAIEMIHNKIMWKKPHDRQWKSNSRAFFYFPRWLLYREMECGVNTTKWQYTHRWMCTRLLDNNVCPPAWSQRNPTKSFLALPLLLWVRSVQIRIKMFCKQLHHTLVSHQIASFFFLLSFHSVLSHITCGILLVVHAATIETHYNGWKSVRQTLQTTFI